jgi:hypothetical protein
MRELLLALLIVVGSGSPAAAGTPDRPGRARFAMAETKFNLGRFAEAAADYQAAYEAEPLPAFLFNIGQCYRNVGNYERAQFYFRRYVELAPRSPNRPDAEHLIAEMERLEAERQPAAVAALTSLPTPAAGGDSAPAFAPVVARTGDSAPSRPIYRRPWFWVGGAALVAGAITVGVLVSRDDHRPSLPAIDAR